MKRFVALRIPLRHISFNHANYNQATYGPKGIQSSKFMSGLQVIGGNLEGALMAACTVLYQAGSRCESTNDYGASHFLRIASTASGACHTKFEKARVLAQHGAAITCRSDRQNISYTLRCPVSKFQDLQSYLLDTSSRCCYNNWEIEDLRHVVRKSLYYRHPQQRVMDLLQKACWRGPLSNSVFCEPERINSITGDDLKDYTNFTFSPQCCTVGSYGLSFDQVMNFAETVEVLRDKPKERFYCSESAPRCGYETEDLGPGSTTWIALGIPGCSSCNITTLLVYNIIAAACGIGHNEMSEHPEDRVPSSPLGIMAGNDIHTEYKAFNISYPDHGVFGILARTRSCSATQVTMCAAEFLAHVGELSFQQIDVGKERLKLSLAIAEEDCAIISESLALQQAYCIDVEGLNSLLCIIDSISPATISCEAQKLSKRRKEMAVAAVGDTTCVPHEKELCTS